MHERPMLVELVGVSRWALAGERGLALSLDCALILSAASHWVISLALVAYFTILGSSIFETTSSEAGTREYHEAKFLAFARSAIRALEHSCCAQFGDLVLARSRPYSSPPRAGAIVQTSLSPAVEVCRRTRRAPAPFPTKDAHAGATANKPSAEPSSKPSGLTSSVRAAR
jgi:hypothetical protein